MMTPLPQDSAELLAVQALSWLIGNEELLSVFLGSTGTTASDIRARIDDPEFLASILDFMLMDDQWIKDFCSQTNRSLEDPLRARAALPGGASVHWT